jgi:hypothetical protein
MQGNPLSLFFISSSRAQSRHGPCSWGSRGRGRGRVLALDLDVANREISLGVEEEEAPYHRRGAGAAVVEARDAAVAVVQPSHS